MYLNGARENNHLPCDVLNRDVNDGAITQIGKTDRKLINNFLHLYTVRTFICMPFKTHKAISGAMKMTQNAFLVGAVPGNLLIGKNLSKTIHEQSFKRNSGACSTRSALNYI